MDKDLKAMRATVMKATLSASTQSTALWYLDKLPSLYRELALTYENRYLEEILRLVQAMLRTIEAPKPVETLTSQFRAMHERHGIPRLALKSAPLKPVAVAKPVVVAKPVAVAKPAVSKPVGLAKRITNGKPAVAGGKRAKPVKRSASPTSASKRLSALKAAVKSSQERRAVKKRALARR
jgi:hypothetical protein